MIVTGLDLSLTGSGVATVQPLPGFAPPTVPPETYAVELREYGSRPGGDGIPQRAARLRALAGPILAASRDSDLVVIEDLYMGTGTGGQLDRAGLWWIVINSLDARGIPIAVVTNNHLKMYALGKGGGKGTDKDYVLAAVIRRYPTVDVTSNNTADALVLAAMGARHLGSPIDPDLPETHLRAMRAVHWPPVPTRQEQHG